MTAPPGPPVRWGFLGAGRIAQVLAGAVHAADGAELVAAAAREPARAAALGDGVRAYPAYEDLLADPGVDAVYVNLPNDAHAPWSVRALEAGKAVLCEKPLALSAAEVDALAAAGGFLVEASWYRWHPRVRLAQEVLRSGRIGAVRHVSAGFTFGGVPADDYRLDPARGGGALYDVGCYAVSACLWAFGDVPRDVVARQRLGPTGVDLVTEAVLDFEAGEAEVRAGVDETGHQWLVVRGDRGEVELRDQPYTSWRDDATELWVSDGRGTERIPVPAVDPYRVMVEEVSSVLSGGPGWVLPLAESRATAAVLDAAFASARAGGSPVPVDRAPVA